MPLSSVAISESTDITPALDGPKKASREGGYKIQLDSLRAIAVVLVLIQHFAPESEQWVRLGDIGVRVFFVLSGYLITGILLQARTEAEQLAETRAWVLLAFYARRFLRIFPLFYAVIIGTALLGSRPMRESWEWHATYLSNIYFYLRGTGHDAVTPLWSLAVEEQFYLVWPFLMLFLRRKLILPLVIGVIIFAPLFRELLVLNGKNAWQASVLMPACLDTLGMGALLAILFSRLEPKRLQQLTTAALVLGLPLMIVSSCGRAWSASAHWVVLVDVSIALFSAWLIHGAAVGFKGVVGRLLSQRPLVHVGAISYGVYLIHNFVPGLVIRLWPQDRNSQSPTYIATLFLITFAIASLSWVVFEAPINKLKRHFPYIRRKAAAH